MSLQKKIRPKAQLVDQKMKKKQNTRLDVIQVPERAFLTLILERNAYLWLIIDQNLRVGTDIYKKIQPCYRTFIKKHKQAPLCSSLKQIKKWIQKYPCKILMGQNSFKQCYESIKDIDYASEFHMIVQNYNSQIAKVAHKNSKIKGTSDSYDIYLAEIKSDMQRLICKENDKIDQKSDFGSVRWNVLPNFMKFTKQDQSSLMDYRLNLYGIRKLSKQEKILSKKRFHQCNSQIYKKQTALIQQYFQMQYIDKEILQFYTKDCFFYKSVNNTLRIAKTTEEFFSIGEPFSKIFDAIKNQYKFIKQQIVFRGADLTQSQAEFLENNIGNYIQIQGFISTSLNEETAKQFAKNRNHNNILVFQLKEVKTQNQDLKKQDYGYVDLSSISSFNEQQILINALNVFKIIKKQQKNGYNYYILEYGSIFSIMQQNPNDLNQIDKQTFYAFRQMRDMMKDVVDIGSVYLKTFQAEKAVKIYQEKEKEMQNAAEEDKQQFRMSKAQAYVANSQPDQALKIYQDLLKGSQNIEKSQSSSILKNTATIQSSISSIQTNTDNYTQAERNIEQTSEKLKQQLKNKWSSELALSEIDLKWGMINSKKKQEENKQINQLLSILEGLLEKQNKKETEMTEDKKKFLLHWIKYYQQKAIIVEKLGSIEQLPRIYENFHQKKLQFKSLIKQGSYDDGLVEITDAEIKRRLDSSKKKQVDTDEYKDKIKNSIIIIQKNSNKYDERLIDSYKKLAQTEKSDVQITGINQAIVNYQKEMMGEEIVYGKNDPRTLSTKVQIANCQKDKKNIDQSLEIFKQLANTKVYGKYDEHSTIVNILLKMGQAYLAKGDFGHALKALEKGHKIQTSILKKNKNVDSFTLHKIQLQMGIYYLTYFDKPKSERYLTNYHNYIQKKYTDVHSERGKSFNLLGLCSLKGDNQKDARQRFQKGKQIYKITQGDKSVNYAKVLANLSYVEGLLSHKEKALQFLNIAKRILEEKFKLTANPFMPTIKFYYAQIYKSYGDFKQAQQLYKQSIDEDKKFYQLRQSVDLFQSNLKNTRKTNQQLKCRLKIGQCMKQLRQADTKQYFQSLRYQLNSENDRDIQKSDQNHKLIMLKKIDQNLQQLQKIQLKRSEVGSKHSFKSHLSNEQKSKSKHQSEHQSIHQSIPQVRITQQKCIS